jgi:hypothetical protein
MRPYKNRGGGLLREEEEVSPTTSWRLWETCCGIRSVISIRDKFAQVLDNTEMIREFNRLFGDLVDECEKLNQCVEKLNQCVDHHGFQDRFLLLVVHHTDVHICVFCGTLGSWSYKSFVLISRGIVQ